MSDKQPEYPAISNLYLERRFAQLQRRGDLVREYKKTAVELRESLMADIRAGRKRSQSFIFVLSLTTALKVFYGFYPSCGEGWIRSSALGPTGSHQAGDEASGHPNSTRRSRETAKTVPQNESGCARHYWSREDARRMGCGIYLQHRRSLQLIDPTCRRGGLSIKQSQMKRPATSRILRKTSIPASNKTPSAEGGSLSLR